MKLETHPLPSKKKKNAWQVTSSLGMKLILQAKILKSTNFLQVTIKNKPWSTWVLIFFEDVVINRYESYTTKQLSPTHVSPHPHTHPLLYFFSFIFISWRLITLQYCSGFCHTLTWISHGFTCVPIALKTRSCLGWFSSCQYFQGHPKQTVLSFQNKCRGKKVFGIGMGEGSINIVEMTDVKPLETLMRKTLILQSGPHWS